MMRAHETTPFETHEQDETWVERAAPWISSFLMHAGIGLLGAFALYATLTPVIQTTYDQPISIPGTVDIPPAVPGLADQTGDASKNIEAMQNMFKEHKNGADPWGGMNTDARTLAGMGDRDKNDPLIALGRGGSMGIGSGVGIGEGSGARAKWGPKVVIGGSVLGTSRAKKTVYLLDHSGSMLDSFDYLRQEVRNATQFLAPFQHFSVTMFSEEVTVLGPDRLQRATPDIKREVMNRMAAIRAQGRNDGLLVPFQKGFEKAFAMKPEVIIFLTDGEFDPRLVEVVKQLNKPGPRGERVEVHTIAYVQIGVEAAESLKKIAAENGGKYKFVAQKDLR